MVSAVAARSENKANSMLLTLKLLMYFFQEVIAYGSFISSLPTLIIPVSTVPVSSEHFSTEGFFILPFPGYLTVQAGQLIANGGVVWCRPLRPDEEPPSILKVTQHSLGFPQAVKSFGIGVI